MLFAIITDIAYTVTAAIEDYGTGPPLYPVAACLRSAIRVSLADIKIRDQLLLFASYVGTS